jgi:hypothetical protein
MHSSANRFPTFAERRGQLVIVTGHHRSLAALIEGRPVLARHPTPRHLEPPTDSADDIDALTDRLLSGERITVGSRAAAVEILHRV